MKFVEKNKKIIIIDDACYYPNSHHPSFIKETFVQLNQKGFTNVKLFICRVFPIQNSVFTPKSKVLSFPYKIDKITFLVFKYLNINVNKLTSFMKLWRIIKNQNIGANNLIILPTASYYLINSIYDLERMNRFRLGFPNMVLNLLNCTEFLGMDELHKNAVEITTKINKLISKYPHKIKLTAESEKYIHRLNEAYSLDNIEKLYFTNPFKIESELYLNQGKELIVSEVNYFWIYCPGAQTRKNKGFYRLLNVYAQLLKLEPKIIDKIKFVVQQPSTAIKEDLDYIATMKENQSFLLLNNYIDSDLMKFYYQKCSAVLLPYMVDSESSDFFKDYGYRGSGIYFEAIKHRKPVIVPNNVGFIEDVMKYGNGFLCENEDFDLAKAIYNSYEKEVTSINLMTNEAYIGYCKDFTSQWIEIFKFNIS